MSCPGDDTLCALFAGALAPNTAERHRDHIAECESCSLEIAALMADTALVRCLPTVPSVGNAGRRDARTSLAVAPGECLDDFVIERQIGTGGMGEVWLAFDVRLARRVVIKVMRPELAVCSAGRTWFEREARTAASFNHPNIVSVFGMGVAGGLPYIVAEHVVGESLAERLARGPVPLTEGLELVEQVTRALAAMHARRISHRDIKPANIMIDGDGRVRVIDFGLAASFDEEMAQGPIAGTPAYMAPECWSREAPATGAVDVWALGLILRQLVDGVAASAMDAPRTVGVAHAPPALRALVSACLREDPEERPRTHELCDWLAAIRAAIAAEAAPSPRRRVSYVASDDRDRWNGATRRDSLRLGRNVTIAWWRGRPRACRASHHRPQPDGRHRARRCSGERAALRGGGYPARRGGSRSRQHEWHHRRPVGGDGGSPVGGVHAEAR